MQKRNRKKTFFKKRYSAGRDFFLLTLVVSGFLILFYFFVYRPVFNNEATSLKPVKAVFKVEEKNGEKIEYYVERVWYLKEGLFRERTKDESVVQYELSDEGYYLSSGGKTYRLEKSLNPCGYPLSPILGRFILEHASEFYRSKREDGVVYLGRDAASVEFRDPFSEVRRVKFIIDRSTGFPLLIDVVESGDVIYCARATYFSELLNQPEPPFLIDKKNAVDVYERQRYDAGEIQGAVKFSIYPPTLIPPELDKFAILKLDRLRLPLSDLELRGELVFFGYYDRDKFIQVIEFKGSMPLNTGVKAFSFQARKREFKLAALPGAYVTWTRDGNVTLVIISNLNKNTIIKVAEGLFE